MSNIWNIYWYIMPQTSIWIFDISKCNIWPFIGREIYIKGFLDFTSEFE